MKNIIKIGALLSCCMWFLCSCEKEDNTFAGTDNFMTSFVLEQNGTSYTGAVTDGSIVVIVPSDVDLKGAKAIFQLCELATITPDPVTITDWNTSCKFTVTSHNHAAKEYTYTVSRRELVKNGNVALLTQADVDAFAALGISTLNGNMTIGEPDLPKTEFDTIKSLDPLKILTKVTGNIVVNNTYAGKNVDGLGNLVYAGNIYIGNESTASNTVDSLDLAFDALAGVAGEVVIHSEKVRSVSFYALKEVLSVFVNAKNVKTITMPSLVSVYGDFVFQSGTSTSASTANSKLTELAFPFLTNVGGSFTVQSFIKMKTGAFPQLSRVVNDLNMKNLPAMELVNITSLTEIGGKFTISSADKLKGLDLPELKSTGAVTLGGSYSTKALNYLDLSALERVNGQLQISYTNITELSMDKLAIVNDRLALQYCNKLTTLRTPVLQKCAKVYFYDLPLLEQADFSQVDSIYSVELITSPKLLLCKSPKKIGKLSVNAGSKVADVPSFPGLEQVDNVQFDNFYNSEMKVPGFANCVKQKFYIYGSYLKTLELPDMETVGELNLGTYNVTSLQIPKLKSAGSISLELDVETLDMPALESVGDLGLYSETGITTWNAPKLKIANSFEIMAARLATFNMPLLREITKRFVIDGTFASDSKDIAITNLDGLSGVTKIGRVQIEGCGNLADYKGLKNALPSLSATAWRVIKCKYNPTYDDMIKGKYTSGL